jgi:hypothetical protein
MKTITVDGSEDSFESGLIHALSYLYTETLKKDFGALADVIEPMLQKCVEVIAARGSMPAESEDTLKMYLILRKFRRLSRDDKQAFIRLLEALEENGSGIVAELEKGSVPASLGVGEIFN